jgi:hypothetical protein
MIYVSITGLKPDNGGEAGGNTWEDTNDIPEAISRSLESFHAMWERLGHGPVETYSITVATENSPKRTIRNGAPLPVEHAYFEGRYED